MAIGCYTEPYLPGTFKFIPFKAMEVSSEHGRRGAEGEFPFGETTAYADLGRRIRTYSIRARFDSNNHVLEAAALIAVCELTGPGPLTHPTRGVIINAACKSLKVTDKVEEEQGVTYVDMEFVEANEWPNGLSLVGQLLGLVVNSIIGPSRTNFNTHYAMSDIQPFRVDTIVDELQEQVSNISTAYTEATVDQSDNLSRNRIINDLGRLVDDDSLAEDTETADKAISLGMSSLAANMSGVNQYRTFRTLANGAAKTSTFQSPAGDAENAIYSLVRTNAAAYMAEGALEQEDATTGEIFDQIDVIGDLLTQEMAYAREDCNNELYLALSDFRTETVAALYDKAYNSPSLVEYNFSGRVHPLNAAYSIYNDAKKHRDLEGINNVGNGGRIGSIVAAESVG